MPTMWNAIAEVMKKVPHSAPGNTAEIIEKHPVETARVARSSVVRSHGTALLARIDAEGAPPAEELAAPSGPGVTRRGGCTSSAASN